MRPPFKRFTSLWMLFLSSTFTINIVPLLCLLFFRTILCSEAEERLVRDLFRDYNKLIRPVELINKTVEVRFVMYLIQLINVNEKSQVMTTNVWLELRWNDYQLKWDPADYGGIRVLRLPADKVWKPDLVLFNNADGNYEVRFKSNVLISDNSEVQWVPPAIYQSSCKIDVTYFPFDQQKCEMKFSSWTFNGDQVSLSFYADPWVDLSDYSKSGTWDIVKVPGFLNVYNNSRYSKPTETDITFHITIRRKTLFYTVNLILPTLLISFLCILVFYLPAEAGEKVTLGISILLSLVVFLLLVSKILPPTSLVLPLIAKYLLFTFIMNCISILVTVVIINWNFRGPRTHRMPNWMRIVFLKYLPILLYMKRPKRTRLRWMMDMPSLGVHYHPSRGVVHPRGPPYHHHHHQQQQPQSHQYPNAQSTRELHRQESTLEDANLTQHHNQNMFPSPVNLSSSSPAGSPTGEPSHLPHHFHPNHLHHHRHHTTAGLLTPTGGITSKPGDLESLEMSNLPGSIGGEMTNSHHHHHHHHQLGNTSPPSPPPPPLPPDELNINGTGYEPYHHSSPSHTSQSNLNYRPNYLGDPDRSSNNNLPPVTGSFLHHHHHPHPHHHRPAHPHHYPHHHHHSTHQISSQSQHAQPSNNNNTNNRGKLYDRETSLDNQSIDMLCLSSAASKATEAIEFIAEHLRAEDEYIQIREDWKYVAMVIDRLQLYIFFLGTLSGTLAILLDAPHIFEYVDQDAVIANHTSKTLA